MKRFRKPRLAALCIIGVLAALAVAVLLPGNEAGTAGAGRGKKVSAGDVMTYGSYEGSPLQWKVLEVVDGKALLLAEKPVTKREYNNSYKQITWEECSLRSWLNDEFFQEAFTAEERSAIVTMGDSSGGDSRYSTAEDRLFLLSIDEAEKYMQTDASRQLHDADGEACWWWLRSRGCNGYNAAVVWADGGVYEDGYSIDNDGAIRPALWLTVEGLGG